MLTKFSVENYKSFNEKITLDLSSSHNYYFNEDALFTNGVVKDAIIFGKNGSGKTNLAFALFDIVCTLTSNNSDFIQNDPSSFLNFNSEKKYASFHYELLLNDIKIIYEYRKDKPNHLIYEQLKVGKDTIFTCDLQNKKFITFNVDKLGYKSFNYENYYFDMSFIKYMLSYASHNENSIIKQIYDFANKMLYFRSLQESSYIGLKNGVDFITQWIINNNYVNEFETFLNEIGGLNLKLDVITAETLLPQRLLVIMNSDNTKPINFEVVKSSGTHALLVLFYWYKHMEGVKLLFIDEFDAFYHFSLSKKVLEMLKQKETLQVILTSHNTYISTNELLRPDCYFTISNGTIKSFIERTPRELREGHNLEKLLRSGEFDE